MVQEVTEAASSLSTEKAASGINLAKALSFSHPIAWNQIVSAHSANKLILCAFGYSAK